MTSLVPDAVCTETTSFSVPTWLSSRMKPEVLQEFMKEYLNEAEIIAIIFLMVDKGTDIPTLIEQMKEDLLTVLLRLSSNNACTIKILESLLIAANEEVLEFMGFRQHEIRNIRLSFASEHHYTSLYLNKAMKSLYYLCRHLSKDQVKKLIEDVNNVLSQPVDIDHSNLYLEYHILEWINQKYISIDPDKVDLSKLLKNLEHNGFQPSPSQWFPFDDPDWGKIDLSNNTNEFNNTDEFIYIAIR